MSKNISVDPDKLDQLANTFVHKLSDIEEEYNRLHLDLVNLIMSAPPEYSHCFYGVGDPWNTGNSLVSQLSGLEQDIRNTGNKFAEADNLIGQLYKLHDKYGALTAMGALVGRQATFYGLGLTQFMKNADNAYAFRHLGALQKLSDVIDNSKYKKVARGFLKVSFLSSKYKDSTFADLVHKKYVRYLPDDVINFTNDTNTFTKGLKNGTLNSSKVSSLAKSGLKFAKSNALTTVAVTGVMEIGGMGLKISENYAKYGNDPDVLKRENAKAVGNAVNNTAAISGGAIAGAVVGGAALSVFGPVGTVVGASAGSFVGGLIGEKVAKYTSGFSEKVALAFDDQIQAGVDVFRSGYEKAGQAVEKLNQGVDYANKQIKETFSDPIGKAKEIGEGLSKAKDTAKSLVSGAGNFLKGKFSFG
ncbi:hypothetical protein [Metabacillus indicus]|uniref:hypothetical protein n=1 Tax=Metabacillus indicus TaxID=246786 RepID=UPI003CF0B17B